ncbi:MAG TPA: A/G-specific adenine glycosylase [Myxococcaceae bacterium]|nr:A/G-specific adenine glycosylase [Myxococcaceae bacterium]
MKRTVARGPVSGGRNRPARPPRISVPAAAELRGALLRWYDAQGRDLPWRRTRDPYAIWVSEVMLQQTQVSVVLPYWTAFLARFPEVAALARASLDEVLSAWRGLGYYARARNLHRAARAVVERHGGRLPDDLEALRALPGFGRYTVGAVASIAFGRAVPLVDGNVARVLARWFGIEGPAGDAARERQLWALAETLVAGERPGDWNQGLMELGATVCRPEQPTCLLCPVRARCVALASGTVADIPAPKAPPRRRALHLAVVAARREDAVLLVRREGTGLFGGLWELPGVECAPGGEVEALRARWPEVGSAPRALGRVERTLTHRVLILEVFAVDDLEPPDGARWVTAAEASTLGISAAMQAVLRQVFEDRSPPGGRPWKSSRSQRSRR